MAETVTETPVAKPLYIVTEPVAFGPPVSSEPRTAAEILKGHPALRKNTADNVAAQCVAAGQWRPYEAKNETLSTNMPVSLDRIAALEERLAAQERELSEFRRMQKPPANRMKEAGNDR